MPKTTDAKELVNALTLAAAFERLMMAKQFEDAKRKGFVLLKMPKRIQ